MRRIAALLLLCMAAPLAAQDATPTSNWVYRAKIELRTNYRDSHEEKFALKFPFPPSFLPVGQTNGFLETVDSGQHVELSVAQLKLDLAYGNLLFAHALIHGQDKYRRNPTSADRQVDADELWARLGQMPEFLDRPERTSFFVEAGKFPKPERQPARLLESYGLAATAFNRFEDVGVMTGGSIGRNVYWRLTGTSGNPLYFRDPNALAGDNGISALLQPNPDPPLKSGFPILYDTRVEDLRIDTKHAAFGQAIGYRWQNDAQTFGFDAIAFHRRRTMETGENAPLTGTFYGVDLDLLHGPDNVGISIATIGNRKEETGGRIYTEWNHLTAIGQYTKQLIAGLHREGEELEVGYLVPIGRGPAIGGEALVQTIQPAVRVSALQNDFKGPRNFVDPSMWWNWVKIDYGVRIGFAKNADLTIERAKNNIVAPSPHKLDLGETLVTLRLRV